MNPESTPRSRAEIAAEVKAATFHDLDAPVERVGAPFEPVPLSPRLEDAYLPGADEIHAAARSTSACNSVLRSTGEQRKRGVMYMVVRSYSGSGAGELFDLLAQREDEIKELISGVPGFVSYAAIRSGDNGMTVTVCEGKEGTDESSKRAAAWVDENVESDHSPPEVTEGETFLHF